MEGLPEFDPETVLVADEDPDVRQLIRLALEWGAYTVFEEDHGILAWRRLLQHRPVVAILDERLPGQDGRRLAHAIKTEPALSHTRVILLTAAKPGDAVAGADLVLAKPFSPADLIRAVDSAVAAARTAGSAARPRRVLVVDDEPSMRDVLADALQDAGYTVDLAGDGAEALRRAEGGPPDLVLLDLMMPVMDGWSFLAERAQRPALSSVPVIVLSAAMGQPEVARAKAAGATPVAKPFDLDVLLLLIEQYTAGKTSRSPFS